MNAIKVTYVPAEYEMLGHDFMCQHVETHSEETVRTHWDSILDSPVDEYDTMEVCDNCQEEVTYYE